MKDIFGFDVQHIEKLHEIHYNLPFLPERIKIGKVEKIVANLHIKTEYVIHIRILKQALSHSLKLKKVNLNLSKLNLIREHG